MMSSGWRNLTNSEEIRISTMIDMLEFLNKRETEVNLSSLESGRPIVISFDDEGVFYNDDCGYTMTPSPFTIDTIYDDLYKQCLRALKRFSNRTNIVNIRTLLVKVFSVSFFDEDDINISDSRHF